MNIDANKVGLLRTLGTALSAVGEVCKQVAEEYDITIPAPPPATTANVTPKPAKTKATTSKPQKASATKDKMMTKPVRKVNDDDHAAVKALRKATNKETWPAARDTLCKERGLTRRQVNGILMILGQDKASVTASSKQHMPKKPRREVTEIDRRVALNLHKETSKEAWPAARDALCIRTGLTRMQVSGIIGVDFKRKHGIRMGPTKGKAVKKK